METINHEYKTFLLEIKAENSLNFMQINLLTLNSSMV